MHGTDQIAIFWLFRASTRHACIAHESSHMPCLQPRCRHAEQCFRYLINISSKLRPIRDGKNRLSQRKWIASGSSPPILPSRATSRALPLYFTSHDTPVTTDLCGFSPTLLPVHRHSFHHAGNARPVPRGPPAGPLITPHRPLFLLCHPQIGGCSTPGRRQQAGCRRRWSSKIR